jgi:hypothetical protein
LAVVVALVVGLPDRALAEPAADEMAEPPPTGRGLIISASIVGGVGMLMLVPGLVFVVSGRNSREGLASAIGWMLTGFGLAFVATGTGLLVPGVRRNQRFRAWKRGQMTAFGFTDRVASPSGSRRARRRASLRWGSSSETPKRSGRGARDGYAASALVVTPCAFHWATRRSITRLHSGGTSATRIIVA